MVRWGSILVVLVAGCGTADPAGSGDGGASGDAGAGGDGGSQAAPVEVSESGGALTISNGLLAIVYDEESGRAQVSSGGTVVVSGAYASVDLGPDGGGYTTSISYPVHRFAADQLTELDDDFGVGKRVVVESTREGKPTIRQIFSMYQGKPFFFAEEEVVSAAPIASSYLGAIIVDAAGSVSPGPGQDPRILDVPFDNDEWVRYDSRVLGNSDFAGTGYEVTAVYESESRHGLVLGSVTHDFWKTGIYYSYSAGALHMNVWGGVATPDVASQSGPTYGKDGTHDVARHGAMRGTTLRSPRIFVGAFDDFRAGLEEFGRACATIAPPRAWSGDVPFGWMSWGAFGLDVTADKLMAVSDFLAAHLDSGGFRYVNIDAGLGGDPAPVIAHLHANGQKVGTYRVPFTYFYGSDPDPLARPVASTPYSYGDIVLRDDDGAPIHRHGGYALDVTHPGTRQLIQRQIESVNQMGYDFLKLDFISDGTLEGRHHDPTIQTGIQAYNQAMKYITELLDPDVFVSLSIAPMFPSQYGHARRISTDVVGQIDDLQAPTYPHYGSIEYMLNSLTYGWWMSGTIYRYNDPDAMALYRFEGQANAVPFEVARTHVVAAAVAGTVFLDSTDYTTGAAADRSLALLTNPGVNALAAKGRSFRPLEGKTGRVSAAIPGSDAVNAGSAATDVFVLDDGGVQYLAIFNYDHDSGVTRMIDLARSGLGSLRYDVTDVWTQSAVGTAQGTLMVTLGPGESTLLALTP